MAKKKKRKKPKAKKPKAKKPTRGRRRRSPRLKPIEGPFQMGLPLQMPLALGAAAFAERAPAALEVAGGERGERGERGDRDAADEQGAAPRAEGEQRTLFG